jgi:hypothetical protein
MRIEYLSEDYQDLFGLNMEERGREGEGEKERGSEEVWSISTSTRGISL